ncbi:MAG: phytoene/squalene synthase family protein [Alphaproteobacteria bacterium]
MRPDLPLPPPTIARRRKSADAFLDRPHGRGGGPWPARMLPAPARAAIVALDRLHRLLDDIADADLPSAERLDLLSSVEDDLATLASGGKVDSGLARIAGPLIALGPPVAELEAMVAARRMGLDGRLRGPPMADLRLHLRRRNTAPLFLILHALDLDWPALDRAALSLGEALGLTETLADLVHDAEHGRLLLPRDALATAGIATIAPWSTLRHPRIGTACRAVARIAGERFADADERLTGSIRQAWPLRFLARSQRILLQRLARRGWHDIAHRPQLGPLETALLMIRARYR